MHSEFCRGSGKIVVPALESLIVMTHRFVMTSGIGETKRNKDRRARPSPLSVLARNVDMVPVSEEIPKNRRRNPDPARLGPGAKR
uniref:Uncharacterized protein n=1 Tax=Candidatus Kentrum sp. TC TaxID=2126339 RepID=A0A450ZLI8_9GAMM|nr:MAG: hypothetical protein BECKTC1821F_GA0114240_1005102 [Candidatus Kentron sp. TC]